MAEAAPPSAGPAAPPEARQQREQQPRRGDPGPSRNSSASGARQGLALRQRAEFAVSKAGQEGVRGSREKRGLRGAQGREAKVQPVRFHVGVERPRGVRGQSTDVRRADRFRSFLGLLRRQGPGRVRKSQVQFRSRTCAARGTLRSGVLVLGQAAGPNRKDVRRGPGVRGAEERRGGRSWFRGGQEGEARDQTRLRRVQELRWILERRGGA